MSRKGPVRSAGVPAPAELDIDALVGELRELERCRRERRGLLLKEASRLRALHEEVLLRLCLPPPRAERRESLRVPCHVEVSLTASGAVRTGMARDFGAGGLFVALPDAAAFAEGALVRVGHVELGDERLAVEVEARVCRVSSEGEPGVALELRPSYDGERERVKALFFALLRRSLRGPEPRVAAAGTL